MSAATGKRWYSRCFKGMREEDRICMQIERKEFMPTGQLTRFTQLRVLWSIRSEYLIAFIDRFKGELAAMNCWVPPADPKSESYCTGLAEIAKSPDKLPPAMAEALLAIEEQVTPGNWPRLQETIARMRRYGIWSTDTSSSPENQALQLWLLCPYRLGGNLAELEQRIEAGKKVWEEKDKANREFQAGEDRRCESAECRGQRAGSGPEISCHLIWQND